MNLHWGQRGLKMEFVIFNYLFVMLLTENALLDMFWSQRVSNLSNSIGASKEHRFEVFHYGLTLHVPIVMQVVLEFEVTQ